MGEETDGVVESVSKLQEKLKALTGVDIVDMNGAYKDTYTILREIGSVWKNLDPMDQAAALELMAGKNRANTLAAILNNMKDLDGAYQSALDANGSALKENEAYLDSIQGKMDQFTNSLQTLWMNIIDSDVVKDVVDLGTKLLNLVNSPLKLLMAGLAGVTFYFTAIKKNNPVTMFKELSGSMHNYGQALNQIKSIQSLNGANGTDRMDTEAFNAQHIQAYGMAVQGLTQKQQVAALATAGLTQEQIAQAIGVRDLTDANFQAALSEAGVINAKKNNVAVSGALILANQEQNATSLSATAQNWLEANSEKEITKQLLAQAVAKGQLEHRDAAAILLSIRQTQANMQQVSSWRMLGGSIKKMIATNPIMFFTMLGTAISSIISKIQTAADKTEKLTEEYNELQSSISSIEGEISSLDSELSTIQEKIDELNSKNTLSITDAEQLNLLKQQALELENQKELQEQLLAAREDQDQVKSMSMINNLIKTTAANQEKNAESWSKTGKIIGGVVGALGAAAAVLLTPVTGGGSLAAYLAGIAGTAGVTAGTVALGAGVGGAMAVGAAGEKAGAYFGGMHNKSDSLIEWYDSYTEAITKAETEAQAAEDKYVNDVTDANYEKWQKKVEAVNTLQTEMYDGLEEMQGYINNLEYNDQTKETIDSYNDLMAHISVTSMDGDVNAQISSIEALKSEYESLSRGVDEHGNNIALTAEEYARYQAIVSQVIGYNVGLTQTFDENGGSIKDAKGEIVSYNSILEETIKLLKQQQQLAAKDAIGLGEDGNSTLFDSYDNIVDKYKDGRSDINWYEKTPDVMSLGAGKNPHGFFGGANWGSNDLVEEISQVIGVDFSVNFGNSGKYLAENIDLIKEKREEIIQQISDTMTDIGLDDNKKEQYMIEVDAWLDDIISKTTTVYNEASNELKQLLYTVPQASDAYYNGSLSGNSLDFINNYIDAYVDGIENIGSLTDDEVSEVRDTILDLTNEIGSNTSLQEAVDELMTLDESSIPVGAYKQKFDKIWEEIYPDENTQELKDANPLYKQLVPDQERIQTMIDAVKQELEVGSKHLVEGLSLDDLEVAYKIRGEYDNDYDEAKKAYEDIVAKRQEAAKSLSDEERYWGNVDQYARNIVLVTDELVEKLKSKELIPEKWTKDDVGTYMTTFGMDDAITRGALSGQHIMYTPILPDGQLLDKNTINEYINKITQNASSEADVLAMDKKGLQIGETFVQGIVNGITNVDDELINSALDPIFASIDESKITKYGDEVNKIVTDNLANAFDITDKETISVLSDSVSGILKDAVENAGADANIKDVIDAQAYELAMAASTSKSYDQHLLQAKIYDEEYAALIRLNNATFTFAELQEKIAANSNKITGPIVETYSTLAATTASLHEIELQTSEIILDNTQVTQEYKDSLIELGITEEELSDYFDDTNKLVVTNAKGLNNLIKNTKSNVAQNAKLAKSQARLQYYELYKKMREYVSAEGEVVQAKVKDIIALYEEMNALEKTIAQYSRLEVELLGAANAYKKFEQAQEMDAQTDYIASAEGMIQALGEAFNTAELGTETAQAAIAGLVPESVFKDLDTVDQKMAAIHKYFKEGKLAQYFDIQFDDDGAIESVEMKLGNLRKFIEDGLHLDTNKDGIEVFEGADWQHFEFSDKFLTGLDSAKDKLQYFADQMGVTKEVAFAFIESINDHDIEWLNGDYSSMFDSLTQSLEGDIFKTTQAIADLNVQLATGKIGAKEYRDAMYGEDGLAAQEEKLADQAREQAKSWLDKSEALEEAKEKLDEYYDMLESGKDKEGNVIDAEKVKGDIESVSKEVETLVGELVDLEEPTELTLQVAIDDIQKDIDKAREELESAKIDLEKAIYVDAEGVYHVSTDFQGNTKLEEYVALLNEQHALEVQMGPETPDVLSTLQSVSTTLDNIRKLLETKYHLELDTSGAYKETTDFKTLWDKISDKSVTLSVVKWVWEKIKSTREAEVNGTANIHGTAHAKGTAHKTGNWGLPTNEHNALVGELGPELVNL